jgi:hypothetical protein
MSMGSSDNTHPRTELLLLYFAAFVFSAVYFQTGSDTPPWKDGSPVEYFTAASLWMSSLICLLTAELFFGEPKRLLFWLAASAGLALLGIDEIFALHEKTAGIVGDDDHIKVLQWFIAGGVIYYIARFEASTSRAKTMFIVGYVLHSIYLLTDIGDGDYFEMPFLSLAQLKTAEEYLELTTLTTYCFGLIFLYTDAFKAKLSRSQ